MNLELNIFKDLNDNKIEYVVWKNTNLIDNFFLGKENLDIYIHKNHHEKFKFLIKKNNWVEVKSTSNNFKKIKHYLFFENNKILHIHAYFKLLTGNSISKNYDLSNYANYFHNKHFDNKRKLWILNYDIQLLLFKLRILLKKRGMLGKYLILRDIHNYKKEIINIKNHTDNLNLSSNNINFESEYLNSREDENDKILLESVKTFKRLNFFQSLFSELFFIVRIFFQKLFRLKKFKLNKKIVIFISGADSSGKTTITNDLENLFKNFFKTKRFSIGKPYPKFLINIFIKNNYFRKKNLSIKSLNTNTNNNLNYFELFKNINLAILRYIYSLNIFYFNQNTNIIILDRYLSENIGDVNGPRNVNTSENNFFKKILSKIEIFFYKHTNFVDNEYKIITNLENCLSRNRKRFKEVKKTDDQIIKRYKNYQISNFKSKKVFEIDNNLSKKNTIKNILTTLSKQINENN